MLYGTMRGPNDYNDQHMKLPGTKPSLHSGQTLTSSGIPSLDYIIGGGIPLGSLVIIEEDLFGDYARLMLNYFVSEGVCNRHKVLVASRDADCNQLIRELPAPAESGSTSACPPASGAGDQMTIAWRYQALPQGSAPVTGRFGQHYDLGQYIEQRVIDAGDIGTWSGEDSPSDGAGPESQPVSESRPHSAEAHLAALLQRCERLVGGDSAPEPGPAAVRRLAVLSLGSPLWDAAPAAVVRCCQLLRLLLRRGPAAALVTVPTHLWTDEASIARLRRSADICFSLESFQGTPAAERPAFSDYHGLLQLRRLSSCHVLAARYPRATDLAFKVRRKRLTIETLHLPPELSETVGRTQEEGEAAPRRPALLCGAAARPAAGDLDF